ncbi:methyltransferase domain-containing protein [Pseudonocardiaceae bacterium YIM PH 21723]|nr:methyltransferase domain-containing protein [Pseudonocardiaceae bacterium YIM PH 21723]
MQPSEKPTVAYHRPAVAEYPEWRLSTSWRLGYQVAIRTLHPQPGQTVLDLGCGPGRITHHLAAHYEVSAIGIDTSLTMIKMARERNAHPQVTYQHGDGQTIDLPDESVDAVLCCFVYVAIAERTGLEKLTAEAHRVLRPGGRFVVLDPNPDSAGVRFRDMRSGDPGQDYAEGEPRRAVLFAADGTEVELSDHHWPTEVYTGVFRAAGFENLQVQAPVLPETVKASGWDAEREHPPCVIISGRR